MKGWIEIFSVLDFIAVGILLTVVAMTAMRKIESCVKTYTLNSWFLSLLVLMMAFMTGEAHLYVAAGLTFLSKGVFIPYFVRKVVRQLRVTHDIEPSVSNTLSLAISGMLTTAVYASFREGVIVSELSRNMLQISLTVLLIGLFFMITRKKAISQVIGLLFMENGLFLAGFSLTFGMPIIIELGILFDMLMGVIILGIFAIQIKKAFASTNLDSLTILKW